MCGFLKVTAVHVDLGKRAPGSRGSTVLCFNPTLHNGYKTCSTGPECPTAAALCSVIQHLGQTPSERAPVSPSCVTVRYQFSSENNQAFNAAQKKKKKKKSTSLMADWFEKGKILLSVCSGLAQMNIKRGKIVQRVANNQFQSLPSRPNEPYGQLVRSLAFPSLQPSLVQSFSPFPLPIMSRTNRKQQHTESDPSADVNSTLINRETQGEYLVCWSRSSVVFIV